MSLLLIPFVTKLLAVLFSTVLFHQMVLVDVRQLLKIIFLLLLMPTLKNEAKKSSLFFFLKNHSLGENKEKTKILLEKHPSQSSSFSDRISIRLTGSVDTRLLLGRQRNRRLIRGELWTAEGLLTTIFLIFL